MTGYSDRVLREMRWIDHRADVIDNRGDILKALPDALVVINEQHPAENVGRELDSERAEGLSGFGQESCNGLDALLLIGVVLAEISTFQIAIREADVVVLDFIEAELGRFDGEVDIRLDQTFPERIDPRLSRPTPPDLFRLRVLDRQI